MGTLKKTTFVFIAFLLALFVLSATVSAVTIDGVLENTEWQGCEPFIVFKSGSSSNCFIDFTMMKIKVENDEQAVYLGFQATQDKAHELVAGNILAGVRLNLKDNEYVVCTPGGVSTYDNNSYDINSKIVIGSNNDFTVEVRIGFKYGIPEKALPGIQVVDGNGSPSNYYSWPVVPTTQATTTEKVTTTKKETTTKETTTKAPTTKKETTTKETTTKAPTTLRETTTKAPTTVRETTTKTPSEKKETTTKTTTIKMTIAKDSTAKTTVVKETAAQKAVETMKRLQNTTPVNENTTKANYPAPIYREETPSSSNIESSAEQPVQWQTAQTQPSGTAYFYEASEVVANTNGMSKSKQIAAIAVAVLLIAIAVCLCVYAGAPKKLIKPIGVKEQENEDDDF